MPHPSAFDPNVHAAVQRILADGTWCQYHGASIDALRNRLLERFQQPFVQLCCSGTIATEIALRGLQVGKGDEVILAAYDFPGNFRAIEAVDAKPVLIDTAIDSWTIDASQLEQAISGKTKCLIVSHLHGHNTPMHRIMQWATAKNIAVVEDTCQAHGAIVDDKPAGSWGDCSTLSFGGSKLMTAGRGGAVLCKSPRVAQRIKAFCERGNDAYPMSQLQAALLLPQFEQLDSMNATRSRNVSELMKQIEHRYEWMQVLPLERTEECAFYKFAFLVESTFRDRAVHQFIQLGFDCGIGFHGFHRRSDHRCRKVTDLHDSQRLSEQTILLQHYHLLEQDATKRILQAFDSCNKVWHENTSH